MTMKTIMKAGKNLKLIRKMQNARRKCRNHFFHKIFSEQFIHDSSNVFFEPTGKIILV